MREVDDTSPPRSIRQKINHIKRVIDEQVPNESSVSIYVMFFI